MVFSTAELPEVAAAATTPLDAIAVGNPKQSGRIVRAIAGALATLEDKAYKPSKGLVRANRTVMLSLMHESLPMLADFVHDHADQIGIICLRVSLDIEINLDGLLGH